MVAMMSLMMPFIIPGVLFGMHLLNLQETQVVCHKVHPCFKDHTVVAIMIKIMVAMMSLMMPFLWCMLFSMHLLNLEETQVVCC
jgi:hypothetical protein